VFAVFLHDQSAFGETRDLASLQCRNSCNLP
jgi:hypothetical protein